MKQPILKDLDSQIGYLSADELFLLGFLQEFNRKSNEALAKETFFD